MERGSGLGVSLRFSVKWAGMSKKKEATESPAEPAKETKGVLVKAAKTIGETAGKIAAAVGVAQPAKKKKTPKLAKKAKSRLPRRQKKAAKKAALAKQV